MDENRMPSGGVDSQGNRSNPFPFPAPRLSINGEFFSVILNEVKDLREAISAKGQGWLH